MISTRSKIHWLNPGEHISTNVSSKLFIARSLGDSDLHLKMDAGNLRDYGVASMSVLFLDDPEYGRDMVRAIAAAVKEVNNKHGRPA